MHLDPPLLPTKAAKERLRQAVRAPRARRLERSCERAAPDRPGVEEESQDSDTVLATGRAEVRKERDRPSRGRTQESQHPDPTRLGLLGQMNPAPIEAVSAERMTRVTDRTLTLARPEKAARIPLVALDLPLEPAYSLHDSS